MRYELYVLTKRNFWWLAVKTPHEEYFDYKKKNFIKDGFKVKEVIKKNKKKEKIMSDPFTKACAIIEQHTRIEIAERELAQAEELVKQKRDNLYNHKAKLWELENEQ